MDYNDPNHPYIMEDRTVVITTRLPANYITVHDATYLTDFVIVIDTVSFVYVPNPLFQYVTDHVVITEIFSPQKININNDSSQVTDTITFNTDRNIVITDILSIGQSISAILYHKPGGGSGNDGNVFVDPAIVAYENALTPPGNVMFTCTSPSTSITLRKPDFGDSDKYEAFRIQRSTFGGNLEIYQDQIWPIYETFDMQWSYLSATIADDLLTFLNTTEGCIMTFHNQFGETFMGYITTPTEKIIQPKVNGFSASLTFQVSNDANTVTAGDV